MEYMKRKVEERITEWWRSSRQRPLLVRGARRVGKSTTITALGDRLAGDGFVRLDFQTNPSAVETIFSGPTDEVDRIVRNISDYTRTELHKDSALIFFDEVQLNERALNSLRFFSESGWAVIASGSLLGVTTKRRTLPFPSGVSQIEMHPMDFEEFLFASNEEQMASAIRDHASTLEEYVLHDKATELFRKYLVLGGMPKVLSAYFNDGTFARVRELQDEIDRTYTADMTDPDNGISGVSALRIWNSLPTQLLRASTKKFKYSEVVRGGRRQRLMEPLEWICAAGMASRNDMTRSTSWPLTAYSDEDGSFFKVYMGDTGIMFHKFGIDHKLFLEAEGAIPAGFSPEFRGALAENAVMQALKANDLRTYYWAPPDSWGAKGEIDFVLQTERGELVPVEVKSGRNVSAKTMESFVRHGFAPYAVVLANQQFGRAAVAKTDVELRKLPLYAAFCLGEGCVKE